MMGENSVILLSSGNIKIYEYTRLNILEGSKS